MVKKFFSKIGACFLSMGLLLGMPLSLQSDSIKTDVKNEIQQDVVQVYMLAEEKEVQAGRPFWVAIQVDIPPGWHIYWKNPGEMGSPTAVHWELPEGFSALQVLWPTPERFFEQGIAALGYGHPFILLAQISPPAEVSEGTMASIKARVQWVACKDSCVPGEKTVSVTLPVAKSLSEKDAEITHLFDQARAHLPDSAQRIVAQWDKESKILSIPLPYEECLKNQEMVFYPDDPEWGDAKAPQRLEKMENTCALKFPVHDKLLGKEVSGLLVSASESPPNKVTIVIPDSDNPLAHISFGMILLAAFFGGILLNAMPCVLPVLSLKILDLVRSQGQNAKERVKQVVGYVLGILLSFWGLAGALILFKGYGQELGWGFQLQEPLFVALLTSLFFLLGLNLFGVFEMGTSLTGLENKTANKTGWAGSFFKGVLATVVATPCTGPFLGTALGAAAVLSPLSSLTIFTSMALGLCTPYLLIGLFPKLFRFLPKPGSWMNTLKHVMGFFLMGTVLWLLWVFGAGRGAIVVYELLGGLLMLSVAAWIYGHFGNLMRSRAVRYIASGISVAITAAALSLAYVASTGENAAPKLAVTSKESVEATQWETYSPERVAELRRAKTPVFIDFTARWCLICQANHVVLNSQDVMEAFEKKGVVMMRADWTQRDAAITEALKQFQRNAVPLYVLYTGEEDPMILPQMLTKGLVMEHLDKIPDNVH